ncbi:MAG TPA: TonB-dependent receptor [Candidatus Latescibacteria bacterium]|nr:hypothetical protein [Gemmatimonadota bacterium]MDP7361651.1 TonB-dependent receptor [Candidatus Latescibacterota bacterium]MDP7633467.1 TonB-dependent receptor [Candidatus Latescibacterota bacterium]HJN30996.1 TonB-dependent receptor [Candidatus Latescibacterota bacterium]
MQTGYGNTYAWLSLNSTLRSDLLVRSTVEVGRVTDDRVGEGLFSDIGKQEFTIRDDRDIDIWSVRQDWSLDATRDHFLKWGFDIPRLQGRYNYLSEQRQFRRNAQGFVLEDRLVTDLDINLTDLSLSLYGADRIRVTRDLTAEVGAKYDKVQDTNDELWSPRLLWPMLSRPTRASAPRGACSTKVRGSINSPSKTARPAFILLSDPNTRCWVWSTSPDQVSISAPKRTTNS